MSGLPYMTLEELGLLFGYTNREALRRALKRGRLKIPTYKIQGKIVADVEVVNAFFRKRREEGLAQIKKESSGS